MMLYIMRAYLMQFAALSNAVCLNNALFFSFFYHLFLQMLFLHIYPVEHMLFNYMAIKTTLIYNKQNI